MNCLPGNIQNRKYVVRNRVSKKSNLIAIYINYIYSFIEIEDLIEFPVMLALYGDVVSDCFGGFNTPQNIIFPNDAQSLHLKILDESVRAQISNVT